MARKVNFQQSVKVNEKKEYFNSKYSLKNVTGMSKVGDEAYVMILKPESYIFEINCHTVKEKVRGKIGFKGIYDTKILCKGFEDDGSRIEETALCCQYADELFKEAKEKARQEAIKNGLDPEVKTNLKIKAPMTFSGIQTYIPLIVMGNTEADSKPSVQKLSISRSLFAYLEINKKSYISEIYNKLKTQVQNSGEIDSEMDESELASIMLEKFKTNIIKITAVTPKSPIVKFEREYSFIPFTNKSIGSKSGEYEAIVNHTKDAELENRAVEFLDLFEAEVDNFVKNWTDDELTKYLIEDNQREKNIETFKTQEQPKVEEKVVIREPEPVVEVPPTQVIAQKSKIEITEEDTSFDSGIDSFIDDDDEFDID